MSKPRIAIIGAGIFGCTCAVRLGSKSYNCTLFEKSNDLMLGASRVNQYRLHRGYHYPRSKSTVEQLKKTANSFIFEYPESICKEYKHIYAIGGKESKINRDQYLHFLGERNLKHKIITSHPSIKNQSVSLIVEVDEGLINYRELKKIVSFRLNKLSSIEVKLNTTFTKELSNEYDYIINCTYGMGNELLPQTMRRNYKYQLVEKIVVKPPPVLKDLSLVIIDGPFMCIDPIPEQNYSVLGNVKLAIHNTSYGHKPIYQKGQLIPWQDITNDRESRFLDFISHGNQFINGLDKCTFSYSMSGYRVIIPGVESTDERLTSISHYDKYIEVFSGKIDTCSWAADQVLNIIDCD